MPMYNLLESSKNHRKATGSLWNYYRDEPNSGTDVNNIAHSILKVTFPTKLLKMCHLKHTLRIFLFHRKIMFHSQDIQVFVFLTIP